MPDNDTTIFDYLNPTDNNILSDLSSNDLKEILEYLNRYYLEYRTNLGFNVFDTFGIEIEIEHFKEFNAWGFIDFQLKLYEMIGNKKWDSRNDRSLFNGREIVSEILTDGMQTWNVIKRVCCLCENNGRIDVNCSSHIHAGSQILGENPNYWYRLFSLWSVYENVIYRFSYGEYLTHRPNIMDFARPAAGFYNERLSLVRDKINDCSLYEMLRILEPTNCPEKFTKKLGLSYWRMLADNNYDEFEDFNKINNGCTVEYRSPNGTLDEIILQNYVNFFIKFMNYCKSDCFNFDILNRRKIEAASMFDNLSAYSDIHVAQAIELCDMIFDNNLDKIYFLRQYLKSFEVSDKVFAKARKFTMTNR